VGRRHLRGEALAEKRSWREDLVGTRQPVVRRPVGILDDADDRDVLREFLRGQNDARIDLIGHVRDQRAGGGQSRGRQPLGRLRVHPDRAATFLVQVDRPFAVRLHDHVRHVDRIEFRDERLRP